MNKTILLIITSMFLSYGNYAYSVNYYDEMNCSELQVEFNNYHKEWLKLGLKIYDFRFKKQLDNNDREEIKNLKIQRYDKKLQINAVRNAGEKISCEIKAFRTKKDKAIKKCSNNDSYKKSYGMLIQARKYVQHEQYIEANDILKKGINTINKKITPKHRSVESRIFKVDDQLLMLANGFEIKQDFYKAANFRERALENKMKVYSRKFYCKM